MKTIKRAILLLMSLLLLLVLLSGCASSNVKLDPKSPLTVTMWHYYGGDMQQAMDALIDELKR